MTPKMPCQNPNYGRYTPKPARNTRQKRLKTQISMEKHDHPQLSNSQALVIAKQEIRKEERQKASHDVTLVDDGSLDTVVSVDGTEMRYDQEFAEQFRNKKTGAITEKGWKELEKQAIDDYEEMKAESTPYKQEIAKEAKPLYKKIYTDEELGNLPQESISESNMSDHEKSTLNHLNYEYREDINMWSVKKGDTKYVMDTLGCSRKEADEKIVKILNSLERKTGHKKEYGLAGYDSYQDSSKSDEKKEITGEMGSEQMAKELTRRKIRKEKSSKDAWYKKDTWTEQELNLAKRRLNDKKVSQNQLFEKENGEWENKKLTTEQQQKGKAWLMDKWKSPTGIERKDNPFGQREQAVLENFESIELKGFYDAGNANHSWYVPLYEVNGDNTSFEYYYAGDKINIVG
jgi:hypothetical protein